jgi:rubrerythrin
MELGTFGAILTYALDFEGRITRFYKSAAEASSAGEAGAVFAELTAEGEKRAKVLERTRRECVAEMILEPITDFHSEDYSVQAAPSAANAAEWAKTALKIEAVAEKFYSTASAKVTVPEVARILKKIAKQHSEQAETLGEL